jgi:hypothetical protein
MQPIRLSWQQQQIRDRAVFRIGRRGGQQLVFLPFLVMKLRRLRDGKTATELGAGKAAARHPFWRSIAARPVGIPWLGFVNRRFRRVELDDFPPVAAIVEALLERARDCPRQPMLLELVRRPVFHRLDPRQRVRLAAALAPHEVPRTSSHGDFHFFNFVRAADGYRLVDWEHYDRDGSFLFDYLDFYLTIYKINEERDWPETLRRIAPEHAAFRRAAEAFGIDPASLYAYYLVLKVDMILRHRGGPERFDAGTKVRLAECVAHAVERVGRGSETTDAQRSLLADTA